MGKRRSPSEAKILEEIRKDPIRSSEQIAAAAGVHPSYARAVARDNDITIGTRAGRPYHGVCKENMAWLKKQAAMHGVTTGEMLNGIITDQRLDAEEEAAKRSAAQ